MEVVANGGITSAKGFFAASAAAGLKPEGKRDLALIFCEESAACAGVYTRNRVKGHSLCRTIRLLQKRPRARALLINAGNANACVGPSGESDAEALAEEAAAKLSVAPDDVLTASTGVIGRRLPLEKLLPAVSHAANSLSPTAEAARGAAEAIMTTDLKRKEAAVRYLSANGEWVTVAGMAKGSGMIHPNLATMIAVLTSDARLSPELLQSALKHCVVSTFNRVSVDGDTSVCDMVLLMASARKGSACTDKSSQDYRLFLEAVAAVCSELARKIAADGEGATKLVDIQVKGAACPDDAYKVALAIARSPLCKTAFFGEDANWGRLLTAAGYSGAEIDEEKITIYLGAIPVFQNGAAVDFSEKDAKVVMSQPEFQVLIDLGQGDCSDHYWTCDFSYDYVRINGSYRS